MSRRSMLRIAAFASSVVASRPTVFPRTSPASTSRSNTHVKTETWVSTSISRRVRDNRRVVRRRLGHVQVQKRPQTQRIGHPPRDPPLGGQPFEIADDQQTEIPARAVDSGGPSAQRRTPRTIPRRRRQSLPPPGPGSDARRKDARHSSEGPPCPPTSATPVAPPVFCPSPWLSSVRNSTDLVEPESPTFATGCYASGFAFSSASCSLINALISSVMASNFVHCSL